MTLNVRHELREAFHLFLPQDFVELFTGSAYRPPTARVEQPALAASKEGTPTTTWTITATMERYRLIQDTTTTESCNIAVEASDYLEAVKVARQTAEFSGAYGNAKITEITAIVKVA